MIEIFINDQAFTANEDDTILDVCIRFGLKVPHLCFHKDLNTRGNCQTCLVEIQDQPKPVIACITPVKSGMRVLLNTQKSNEVRQEMLHLLLATHPKECAVCAKAGECQIQEISFEYGSGLGSFKMQPPVLKEQYLGHLIQTHLQRCVLCQRCVQFIQTVAGKNELVLSNFSTQIQIECLNDQGLTTSLSGNLLDLCPSGAMTDKTTSLLYRPWELESVSSIDITDGVGSNIYIDTSFGKIARIRPKENIDINQNIISDNARFSFKDLTQNRLDRPYVRIDGVLKEASWTEAFMTIASKIKSTDADKIAGVIGQSAECESMMALRDLLYSINAKSIEVSTTKALLDQPTALVCFFNTMIKGIDQADALLMIDVDVESIAPVLNARIRKNKMPKALIGQQVDLAYPYAYLGNCVTILDRLIKGSEPFSMVLEKAKNPMIIVGMKTLERLDALAILDLIYQISTKMNVIRNDWNGFNVLHENTTTLNALKLGLTQKTKIKDGGFEFVYALNEDTYEATDFGSAFLVYQGIYRSQVARRADVLLPSLAYTQKTASYVNIEGRVQSTAVAIPANGMSREDWKILRALSEYLETPTLPYDDLESVRDHLAGEDTAFYRRGEVCAPENKPFGVNGKVLDIPFGSTKQEQDHE